MNYDETVFVNPDKLGLDEGDTLDELYRKLYGRLLLLF